MAEETRWTFHRVYWTLYLDDGLWMAFSSAGEDHATRDKANMESWLESRGLKATEAAKLLAGADENGETAIATWRLHEPPR